VRLLVETVHNARVNVTDGLRELKRDHLIQEDMSVSCMLCLLRVHRRRFEMYLVG
jgi:hypothetical protein